MGLATRDYSKKFLAGLAKCIKNDPNLSDTAKSCGRLQKIQASGFMIPKKGAGMKFSMTFIETGTSTILPTRCGAIALNMGAV